MLSCNLQVETGYCSATLSNGTQLHSYLSSSDLEKTLLPARELLVSMSRFVLQIGFAWTANNCDKEQNQTQNFGSEQFTINQAG